MTSWPSANNRLAICQPSLAPAPQLDCRFLLHRRLATMLGLQYWFVPILSAVLWTAMLITMLAYWAASGKPRYATMAAGQHIPYISGGQGVEMPRSVPR